MCIRNKILVVGEGGRKPVNRNELFETLRKDICFRKDELFWKQYLFYGCGGGVTKNPTRTIMKLEKYSCVKNYQVQRGWKLVSIFFTFLHELCDSKKKKFFSKNFLSARGWTQLKVTGTQLKVTGTQLKVTGTQLKVTGTQ